MLARYFRDAAYLVAIVSDEMQLLNVAEDRSQGENLGPVESHIDKDNLGQEPVHQVCDILIL